MKANIIPNYVFAHDSDFSGSILSSDDVSMRLSRYAEDIKLKGEYYQKQLEDQEGSYGF